MDAQVPLEIVRTGMELAAALQRAGKRLLTGVSPQMRFAIVGTDTPFSAAFVRAHPHLFYRLFPSVDAQVCHHMTFFCKPSSTALARAEKGTLLDVKRRRDQLFLVREVRPAVGFNGWEGQHRRAT